MLKKVLFAILVFTSCLFFLTGCSKNLASETDIDKILSKATILMCTQPDGTILYSIENDIDETMDISIPADGILYLATNDWKPSYGAWDLSTGTWAFGPVEKKISFHYVKDQLLYIHCDWKDYDLNFEVITNEMDTNTDSSDATTDDTNSDDGLSVAQARDLFWDQAYAGVSHEEIEQRLRERNSYAMESSYTPEVSYYWENVLGVTDVSNRIEPMFFSDYIYYDVEDFSQANAAVLKIAKNEIYARHGYIFNNQDLQNYFMGCAWYEPKYTSDQFDASVFNECEVHNLNVITSLSE